jgi:hypothetical protein
MKGDSGDDYDVDADPLNETGGQSVLYGCRDSRGRRRVYKRYNVPVGDPAEIGRIAALAGRGARVVADAERTGRLAETALSSINWPIDVVRYAGDVAGVVLPLIPAPFLQTDGRPLTFDYLCLASQNPPKATFRVGVLIRACDIFAELEQLELAHGDVSAKNLVWSRDEPHAYLIDCDGLRPYTSAAQHGVGTEGFRDPRWISRRISAHDRFSDRFGLAAMMYRGLFLNPGAPTLVHGRWTKPSGIPSRLDQRLQDLFADAFDDPFATDARPTAARWRAALYEVFVKGGRGGARNDDALEVLNEHAQYWINDFAATTSRIPKQPPGRPAPVAPVRPRVTQYTYLTAPPAVAPAQAQAQAQAQTAATTPATIPAATPANRPGPSRGALVLGVVAVAVGILAIVLVTTSRGAAAPGAQPPGGGVQTTASPAGGSDQDEQQEAQAISDLLGKSSSSRSLVSTAVYHEVGDCSQVSQGAADLRTAASDRGKEREDAEALDVDAIGGGAQMKTVLVAALQYSYDADEAYAQWAEAVEDSGSCSGQAPSDSHSKAGDTYSGDATTQKNAFLKDWQPIASSYGFPVPSGGWI